MSSRDRFLLLCVKKMEEKGLLGQEYRSRLLLEVKHVDNQADHDYFLELYDNKFYFAENENNLLVPYLLGLCPKPDLNIEAKVFFGDWPDVDVDFCPPVQNFLREEWAPKTFGADYVCSVGSYSRYGIKNSLIDMARIHGKDRNEIISLTKKIGLKDDEGDDITWDKAMEMFPDLKAYCDANPEVADSAHRLIGRIRGMSTHAGGLIISRIPIDDIVPIVLGKDGMWVSAFVEGLHGQDLGPLGLIKFDCLSVNDLLRVSAIVQLVKQRHGLNKLSAKEGMDDWSDKSYLNDPASLKMANEGDLIGIFQFDSEGIRNLCKKGGVDHFNDLAAYNAIYRPSLLSIGSDKVYVDRKRGIEPYAIHPEMEYLKDTYGINVYQEQILRTLNKIGGIPLTHCEIARKSISKKDLKKIAKMKPDFVAKGKKVLGWDEEDVNELWGTVESFAGYGFNKSHAVSYCYLSARLLYLKTHHPLEFYAGTLMCESDTDKIKEYKLDAEKHGVKLNRVNVNKSGWNFTIVDNEIYMGFSNIKGIGEEASQKIVEGQPYSSFVDFLERFGTNANVIKPLIGLGVFDDADRATLLEFYERYASEKKKREDRDKRSEATRQRYVDELIANVPMNWINNRINTGINSKDEFIALLANDFKFGPEKCTSMWKTFKKYVTNMAELARKKAADQPVTLDNFVATGKIDEELAVMYKDMPQVAEARYYGFAWDHFIEYSPDYTGGMTFDRFEDETKLVLCVECQIVKKPEKRTSKNGKTNYYTMMVEDANCNQRMVTIWEEDFKRFEPELSYWSDSRRGNLIKIRLERPGPGFRSYTMESWPRQMRAKFMPKTKEQDYRLVVMTQPEASDFLKKEIDV